MSPVYRFCHIRNLALVSCTGLTLAGFIPASQAAGSVAADLPFEITRVGDLEMSCEQITGEVSDMEKIVVESNSIQEQSKITGTGISVGKAVGSYLVGSLLGGIGILAAGYVVSEAADDQAENAEELAEAALQRRSFMAGIHKAKGCVDPLVLADIAPAAGDQDAVYGPPDMRPKPPQYSYND